MHGVKCSESLGNNMYFGRVLIMNKYIRWGIIGLVTVLTIFGGIITLTDDELANAYYCDNHGRIGIFDHLSSTNKSGYWLVDEDWKRATCTKSKWIPLVDYCEAEGITNCNQLTNTVTAKEDVWTQKYWCTDTCEEVYE